MEDVPVKIGKDRVQEIIKEELTRVLREFGDDGAEAGEVVLPGGWKVNYSLHPTSSGEHKIEGFMLGDRPFPKAILQFDHNSWVWNEEDLMEQMQSGETFGFWIKVAKQDLGAPYPVFGEELEHYMGGLQPLHALLPQGEGQPYEKKLNGVRGTVEEVISVAERILADRGL